jgi:thioredoxin-like negative regulator of GroEL
MSRWGWPLGVAGVVAGCLLVAVVASFSNRTSPLVEAQRALAEGRAGRAERALVRASLADPTDPMPWRLRLELLRLEDRRHEAAVVGREALDSVRGPGWREVLKALTLALLADVPEDTARAALQKFVTADPDDTQARVALLRLLAQASRPGDPGPAERAATLEDLVKRAPEDIGAREAWVEALLDIGEPARASGVLEQWPSAARDERYDRLAGRLALEHDRDPARAISSLERAVKGRPQDWGTRSLLARARRAAGDEEGARREAEAVARLREVLGPRALGKRLEADLMNLDDEDSRRDMADLCERVGLVDLALSWRKGP